MARAVSVLVAFIVASAAAVGSFPAYAHPHAWIDLSVAVVFDDSGRVTGLRQTWLLDDYYTAYATQGRDGDGDGKPDQEKLEELLALNLSNLAEYSWFTRVWQGDRQLDLASPRDTETHMVGPRLEMSFFVPLTEPVDIAADALTYAVFDPTYYIEVLHAEEDDAYRLDGSPAGCTAALKTPNPTAEAVSLAASLDRTQSAGDGLGILFAEKVVVRCG